MTAHDPLCPNTTLHMDSGEPQRVVINCQCALVARVRADERKRLRTQVEALHRVVIDGEPHVTRGEVLALLGGEPDA